MQAGLGAARSRPAADDDPQHRLPHTAAARAGCTGTAALLGLPAVLRGSISSHSPPELRLCCGTGDASSPPVLGAAMESRLFLKLILQLSFLP